MDTVSLQLAFSRLGADVAGQQRPLCAMAQDGSLVLVCRSSGFSRPGAGVLRYSAKLSQISSRQSQVESLRLGLGAATRIRMIVHTAAVGAAASRIHYRGDLVGSVVSFDGDAFSVDFVRKKEEEPERPRRSGRRR